MGKDGPGRVHVAAFGKHPGWDDHIEEIGLDCDALVQAKRVLYTEGIAGNIDAGAWEKLPDDHRRAGFKHVFFWRSPVGLIVGRMWSSRDGKGRSKYPMVVCGLVEGASAAWAVPQILPRLEQIESRCAQTNSAEMVRLAIGEARRALEDQVALLVGAGVGGENDDAVLVKQLLAHPDVAGAGGGQGLTRLLYEVEREMAAFRSVPGTASRMRTGTSEAPGAQHLRVPRGLSGPGEAARAWLTVVSQEVVDAAPVLVFDPIGEGFLDIIVGQPRPKDLFFVRASVKGQAPTSEVPYTIDAAFQQSAAAKVAAWSRGELRLSAKPAAAAKTAAAGGGGLSRGAMIGIGVGALVVLGAAIAIFSGGGDEKPPEPKPKDTLPGPNAGGGTTEPEKPKPSVPPPQLSQDDPRAGWGFESLVARTRSIVAELERERKSEGGAPDAAMHQRIERAVEREEKFIRTATFTPASREGLLRDMRSVETEVQGVLDEATASLAAVRSRIREFLEKSAAEPRVATEAMKQAWGAAIRGVDPAAGWENARAKVGAISSGLRDAEAGISAKLTVPPLREADLGTVSAAEGQRRDVALRQAAEAAVRGEADRVRAVTGEYETWVKDAARLLGAAADAEQMLARGQGAGAANDPASVRGVIESMKKSPAWNDLGLALGTLTARVEVIGAIEREEDPSKLLATMRDSRTDLSRLKVAETMAAWARLADLVWPTDAESLRLCESSLAQDVRPVLARVEPADVRTALTTKAGERAKAMWRTFTVRNAGAAAGMDASMSSMPGLGVSDSDVAALPEWARFNVARFSLEKAATAAAALTGSARDSAQRAAIDAFVGSVEPMGVAKSGPAAALLSGVKELRAQGGQLDLAKLGPGTAGWSLEAGGDSDSVVYLREREGRAQRAEFRRIEAGTGDEVSFVCTTEMSVGGFADAIGGASKWEDVRDLLPKSEVGGIDPRGGPRAWVWSSSAITASRTAGPGDTSKGWVRIKTTMSGLAYYPEGLNVPAPGEASPMTYVSPHAALLAARAVGCRLPTIAEWKAAAGGGAEGANLRDATWKRQYEHIKQYTANGPEFPGSGVFRPAGAARVQDATDGVPAIESDDGVLWFAPVTEAPKSKGPFRHLVGNAAEYVCEDAAGQAGLQATRQSVDAFIGKGEKIRVIGGSALSPAELKPDEPQPLSMGAARGGYADVGFRLAFSAPRSAGAAGAGERLAGMLASNGYLRE